MSTKPQRAESTSAATKKSPATPALLAQKASVLTPDRLDQVLDFIEFLQTRSVKKPRRSLSGLWTGFEVSDDSIDQARREMWGQFGPVPVLPEPTPAARNVELAIGGQPGLFQQGLRLGCRQRH